ncbi:YggT family protein [Sessilibacter corallicola]|uniref:YggT family protein n=1 Tax=Sessilibacter corallicola TaxID=2904075 RepID=UPI001E3C2FEE|nr:YggT family protein [Sessilibacter corallicola]MCE2027728.1 YggT family protein [Sessilibacter corallicola]
MQALSSIATLLIQTLASLYLFLIVLRFLLQLARADFYNPISQAVVKYTNPALVPLRRIIPSLFGLDTACILLAIFVGFVAIELNYLAVTQNIVNPLLALAWAAIGVAAFTAKVIFFALIISIIVSFVAPQSFHPALVLINQLLDPIRAPFQKILPPMGGFDLSPILIILTIQIVEILLKAAAAQVQLVPPVVPGYW